MMNFRVRAEYRVIKNSYATNHEAQKIYAAPDAPAAVSEFLNEITSTADGMITMIKIAAEMEY